MSGVKITHSMYKSAVKASKPTKSNQSSQAAQPELLDFPDYQCQNQTDLESATPPPPPDAHIQTTHTAPSRRNRKSPVSNCHFF
ncbi:hypothetical protein TMatcc_000928 [Talaromyces marneffei ATCC 18224]